MGRHRWFMTAVVLGGAVLGSIQPGLAQEVTHAAPEDRLEALDQKVKILERRWELEQEAAAAKAKEAPAVGAGKDGFFLKSADGNFQFKLRGYLHADGRTFFGEDANATNQALIRRARPLFEGTLYKHFDFRILTDFGEGKLTLLDAYLDAGPWPVARVQVGKFKVPFGLERLQSITDSTFVELGFPTSLAPNRDVGAALHGDLARGAVSYAVGVFDGVADGGSTDGDTNDDKDLAARVFAQPFKATSLEPLQGLGLGAAVTYGHRDGTPTAPGLPSYKTAGQGTFFKYNAKSTPTETDTVIAKGKLFRLSPQAYYYVGPLGVLAEYVLSSQEVRLAGEDETLTNQAWQVAVSYVVTGEEASFKGVKPRKLFDPSSGGWGALEVAARYGVLTLDDDAFPTYADPAKSAREAKAWAAGANWYLNRAVKVALTYENTRFEDGAADGDREDERVLLTRVQVSY